MRRFPFLIAGWAALLVAGFAAIALLGGPLADPQRELEAALHPKTPVSEAAAVESAATIVRLSYPNLLGAERRVDHRTDFGIERFLVVYTDAKLASGVRISIAVETGRVEVASFP
jgi:hypothetical protein